MRRLLAVESEEELDEALFGNDSDSITEVLAGCVIGKPTAEDLTAAFIAQCQEDGRADDLDAAFDLKYARYFDQSGQRKVARNVLRRLGLSALLEDAGSEEGKPCEGF